MINNNWLLTFIFILTILTIIHIAYYLLQLMRVRKPATIGSTMNSTRTSTTNNLKATTSTSTAKAANNDVKAQPEPKTADATNKNVFYTQSDNFQKVEGIGPAIEETLKTAGIRSYKQLADSDYSTLKSILMSKGSKFVMHDPRNWPKQAKLALDGKWEELDKLKEELIRGK
jgi:predicted flap endonuclease-1-like 5' DNA nuclease